MSEPEDTTIAQAILLAGDGERLAPALLKALGRRGIAVDRCARAEAAQRAYVTAPDMVVLVGDAARDLGRDTVSALAAQRATSSIPVAVVVADPGALAERLDAFKHGVVSLIERTASVEQMASRIAAVVEEVPQRSGELHRGLANASVDELVELFARELRSGILSVAAGPDDVSAQVVLHADRPVQQVVGELVDRLRPLVSRAQGPLRYEFFESPSDRLGSLLGELGSDPDLEVFDGLRMVLVEQRAARSDALAQELRAVGARVVVADGAGVGLDRAVPLDPQVVVFDGKGERGWALGALRALRRDPRLRWASVLVVDEAQLWRRGEERPDLAALSVAVAPLIEPDRDVAKRLEHEPAFDLRLEALGPSRLLRALAATGRGLQLRVNHPSAVVEVDVADGLIAGAMARAADGSLKSCLGPAALSTLLALSSGRARVQIKDAPARADVMAPVDDAFAAARSEAGLVTPSVLPPSHPPVSALPGQTQPGISLPPNEAAMVTRLESLIDQLSTLVERGASLRPPPSSITLPGLAAPSSILPPGAARPIPGARTGGTKLSAAPPPAVQPPSARPSARPSPRSAPRSVPPPPPPGRALGRPAGKPKTVPPPPPGARLPSARPKSVPPPPSATARSVRPPSAAPGRPRTVPPPPGARLPSTRPKSVPPPPSAAARSVRPPSAAPRPRSAAPGRPRTVPPPAPKQTPTEREDQTPLATNLADGSFRAPKGEERRDQTPLATSLSDGSFRPPMGEGSPARRRRAHPTLVGIGGPVSKSFAPPAGRAASTGPRPASVPASAVVSVPPEGPPYAPEAAPSPAAPPVAIAAPSLAEAPPALGEPDGLSVEVDLGMPIDEPPVAAPAPPPAPALAEPPVARLEAAATATGSPELGAPVLADDEPLPRSRARLFLGIAAVLALVVIGGGAVAWTLAGADGPDADPPPTATGPQETPAPPDGPEGAEAEPGAGEVPGEGTAATGDGAEPAEGEIAEGETAEGEGHAEAEAEGDGAVEGEGEVEVEGEGEVAEVAPAEVAPPPSSSGTLAESDPLEGSDADFSLSALGIEPIEMDSRRRRRRVLRDLVRRGNARRNQGRLDEAEAIYERMLALDPENARATVGMCRIAMEREQGPRARMFAQRLVRMRPRYASNWVLLGDTFELVGDDRAALRAWTRAHDIDPRWAPARERLARVQEPE